MRTSSESDLLGANDAGHQASAIPAGTGRRLRTDFSVAVGPRASRRPVSESPLRYLGSLIIAAPLALLTMLALCLGRAGED
jgi:hypothetical protein